MSRRTHSAAAPATAARIAIVAAGAVSAVGASAASTCCAMRAGLDHFEETAFVDGQGQALVGAGVPQSLLADTTEPGSILGGAPKLAAMLARALAECLMAGGDVDPACTVLLVIGPEATRPCASLLRHEDAATAAIEMLGLQFHESSQVLHAGGAGFVEALRTAGHLLSPQAAQHAQRVQHVLVAGVDSLLNGDDIARGVAEGRLLCGDNADGFIPGEAAACLLLRAVRGGESDEEDENGATPLLEVVGLGRAEEHDSFFSERANSGRGLADAMRQALKQARVEPHAVHQRLGDGAGESFFMDEAVYAWGRVLRSLSPPGYAAPLVAAHVGQTGAAAGPLMATLVFDMALKGWGGGAYSLLHFSGSGDERAAVVLRSRAAGPANAVHGAYA